MTTPAKVIRFPSQPQVDEDPVVVTGVGIVASTGSSREEVWQTMQTGRSGVRLSNERDPVRSLRLPCALIDWLEPDPESIKSIQLSQIAAQEALEDAHIDWRQVDRSRFACSISAQLGDMGYLYDPPETRNTDPSHPWWNFFLPCCASDSIANQFRLYGPRLCHTTACASGLVSTLAAARTLLSGQADFALCGAADAISELVIAAFNRIGVLSTGPSPESACRPFDVTRSGFVMGEGAAMLVLEKRSHAIGRGATIYAEIAGSQALCQAHHVTGLDSEAETLKELISRLVDKAGWSYRGPQYINAHGTGTTQNDTSELMAIRAALGDNADNTVVSSSKAVLGHLINAAGSVELALTALSLRDGFAPPTMHLQEPEQTGNLDCLPEFGCQMELDRALKLSLAFGGHLVGMALRRCPFEKYQRPASPLHPEARIRQAVVQPVRRAA
jgi:3-oxoacyl-(acyl-carrier-protein) synthase